MSVQHHCQIIFRGASRVAGAAIGLSLVASPATAKVLPQQSSANTVWEAIASLPNNVFSGKRDRNVLAAQVMLDRAHFSPGVIDGLSGGNTTRAVKAWQSSNNLKPTGRVDAALIASLRGSGQEPVMMPYTLREDDVSGPFGELPEGMESMAGLDATHYETAAEGLAEKFHMAQEFLREINPGADLTQAGTTITVAAIRATPIESAVTRIEVDRGAASLRAYAADGRLLASYPATVGSSDFPSPSGTMEVRAIAPVPAYYFSPEGRDWGPDKKLTIAPGPNNPVGSTWIDLSKDGYGIHGTPDPRLIGKTASHGCVRLTNWDAKELSLAVKTGTTVEFL